MTRPHLIPLRNVALVLVGGMAAWGAYRGAVRLMRVDPFAGMARPVTERPAVVLNDVDLRQYKGGQVVTQARLGRVVVSQDRQRFTLTEIHDGVYRGEKGAVRFDAAQGNWDVATTQLNVHGGAHVTNAVFDLRTDAATLDRRTQLLQIRTPLSGRLYGGELHATNLKYTIDEGDASVDLIEWKGQPSALPAVRQNSDAPQEIVSHTWQIKGKNGTLKGSIVTSYDARAEDGEIIVMAPKVVQDRKTDILTATGRVTYYSGKANVVADKAVIYRKEHRAVFTGNVVMLVKPKKDQDKAPEEQEIAPFQPEVPDSIAKVRPPATVTTDQRKQDEELRTGKNLRDYPMTINAQMVTYWYQKGSRHAKIEGAPQARQDFDDGRWRHVWAHDADYDAEKDTLRLNSSPGKFEARMKNSIGDDLKAFWLQLSTKEDQDEDNEEVEGDQITGTFVDRSGEDPRGDTKSNATKPQVTRPPVGAPTKTPPTKPSGR